MEGLLLGLSNGTVCLAHCAPVIVPLFLGGGERTGKNAISLSFLLAGRLIGYMLFSVAAWGTGRLLVDTAVHREVAGDAAVYFGTFEPEALADQLEAVLGSPAVRDALARRGRGRSTRFSWEHHVREIVQLLDGRVPFGEPARQ